MLGRTSHGVYDNSNELDSLACTVCASRRDDNARLDQMARLVEQGQERHVRHAAVPTPESRSPFANDIESKVFFTALGRIKRSECVPAGFGLSDTYESVETYSTGHSRKGLRIPLPYNVWFPRVLLWCQAVDLYKRYPMVVRGL